METRGKELTENESSKLITGICLSIHRYGPGLFESEYEELFSNDWNKTEIPFQRQQGIPLVHEQLRLDASFRADFIIDNKVIIELKPVEVLAEVNYKQVRTYLKLTGLKLGLLINFNVPLMKQGIHRIVNRLINFAPLLSLQLCVKQK
jgi:GxxExxY protein